MHHCLDRRFDVRLGGYDDATYDTTCSTKIFVTGPSRR
jgi:hypothetical protein